MTATRTVIVLAAGRGMRFEAASHKLAAPFFGDESVLGATLRHAVASQLHVLVVTTEAFAAVSRSVVAARDVIVLPDVASGEPGLGMGRSISAGVAARPHAAGWLVLPGDMPLVQASTLDTVARQLEHHPVVYAQHNGRRGHPVGFAAGLYSELVGLSGDSGARRIVARYPAHGIELDDVGVLVDIDTVDDLEAARRSRSERPLPDGDGGARATA